jgi:hypothetical protein
MRRPGVRGWPFVLALAVLAFAAGAMLLQHASLPHVHSTSAPGLYNSDHDLTLLATLGGGAPMPDRSPAVSPLPDVAAVAAADLARPAASPLRYSAPRAPPLA